MNILITGGAGFIGSQLGFYLMKKKHKVFLVDNLSYGYKENLVSEGGLKPHFIQMDIRDSKISKLMKDVDIVYHLAGISSLPECQNNPNEAYQVNVAGTAHILEEARRNNIRRVIFSSTSAIYENEKIFPTPEDIDSHPSLIYCLSKKHAEEICKSYRELYGMDITILRFFNVYGPHMDYRRPNPPLVSYIIKCLLENKNPLLHSDGKQARDMIYVDDILRLCEIVATHKKAKNEVFNVGSGEAHTVKEVFNYIIKAFGKTNIKPTFRPEKLLWENYKYFFIGDYPFNTKFLEKEVNKYTLASIEKTTKILGWKPEMSLEEGLRKTVAFAMEMQ